jgi:hypothetical protein
MIDELRPSTIRGYLFHPALLLAGLTLVVALALLPFAVGRTDSGGPVGLTIAAAVCLLSCWLAEGFGWLLRRHVPPVSVTLVGMAIRMAPPLALCLFLAASGQSGRQHLAFIGYLLAFYMVTLALETYLAVRRISQSSNLNHSAR